MIQTKSKRDTYDHKVKWNENKVGAVWKGLLIVRFKTGNHGQTEFQIKYGPDSAHTVGNTAYTHNACTTHFSTPKDNEPDITASKSMNTQKSYTHIHTYVYIDELGRHNPCTCLK